MHSAAMTAHTSAAVSVRAVPFASRSKAQQRRVDMTPPRELERQQQQAEQTARQTVKATNKKPRLIFDRPPGMEDDRPRIKSRQHRAANPLLLGDRGALPLSKQDRGVFLLHQPGARLLHSNGVSPQSHLLLQQLRTVLPSLQSYVQQRVQGHFACGGVHVTNLLSDGDDASHMALWCALEQVRRLRRAVATTAAAAAAGYSLPHRHPIALRLELRANGRPLAQLPRVMYDQRVHGSSTYPYSPNWCSEASRAARSAGLKETASAAVATATGHRPSQSRDLGFLPVARSFRVSALLRVEGAHTLDVKPPQRRLAQARERVARYWVGWPQPRWLPYSSLWHMQEQEQIVNRGVEVTLFFVEYTQSSSRVPARSSPMGLSPARRTLTVTKQVQRAAKRICVTTVAARKVQRRHQRALQDRVRQSDCDDRRRERAAHETEGEGEES
jgi:hypothetical protein